MSKIMFHAFKLFFIFSILITAQGLFAHSHAQAAGYYAVLRSSLDGRCLDADANIRTGTDFAKVQMWTCNGRTNQIWYIEEVGAGAVSMRNLYSQTCLDNGDPNVPLHDGSGLVLYRCHGGLQQQWRIWPKGSLVVISPERDYLKFIDYDINNRRDGGVVQIWSLPAAGVDHFEPQQLWTIMPTQPPSDRDPPRRGGDSGPTTETPSKASCEYTTGPKLNRCDSKVASVQSNWNGWSVGINPGATANIKFVCSGGAGVVQVDQFSGAEIWSNPSGVLSNFPQGNYRFNCVGGHQPQGVYCSTRVECR